MDFDVVIIGSGFGGSISAMRLTQKGYKVLVLEKGSRFQAGDFPESNWQIRKFFWLPWLRCFGFQAISMLKGLMLVHGVGVGGGSLVYANTLMKPKDEVFADHLWPNGVAKELIDFFEIAKKMLGVVTNPYLEKAEEVLRRIGLKLGVSETFHPTEVGVYFGEPDVLVDDPYFGGKGPKRSGCNRCGGCMVGCRYLAKNTLDLNYLYFAEKWGAKVISDTEVVKLLPIPGGYEITTRRPSHFFKRGPTYRGAKVIVAAGVL